MEHTCNPNPGARHWRVRWGISMIALASVLLSTPSHAEETEDLLRSGIASYGLADFKRSRRTLEKAAARTTDAALLSRIHFYIGCNEVVLERMEQARDSFRRAVELEPALDPDPGEHKPAVIEAFRLVRASMVGLLRLSIGPGKAEVLLDDRLLSGSFSTPQALPAGAHGVEVRRAGEAPIKRTVVIEVWSEPTEQQRQQILEGRLCLVTLNIPFATTPKPPPMEVTAPPPVPSGRRTKTILGYTALALAGAAAAGAGALYGLGITRGDEAHELYMGTNIPYKAAIYRVDVEAAQGLVIGGHVLAGVAAASLGFAIYALVSRPAGEAEQRGPRAASADLMLTTDGVLLRGRF